MEEINENTNINKNINKEEKVDMEENENMIKYVFTFPSSNNQTNIHAIICYPKNGQYTRIIQILHGKREYIERYLPFMEYLTTKGYIAVGHDYLGHGQSINSKEDLGFIGEPNPNELIIKDIHTLHIMMHQKYPNLPYFMCGHSWGSYLLRQYICLCSQGLNGVILLGSGYESIFKVSIAKSLCEIISFFKGSRHKSQLITNLSKGKKFQKFDTTRTDIYNSWITRDPEIAKDYNEDKKRNYEFTLNAFIGMLESTIYSCDPKNICKVRKDLPILFASGSEDPIGNFGEGVKKSYNLFKEAGIKDVTMKIYQDARHELLQEINRKEVFEYIKDWMEEKLLSSDINKND